MDKYVIALLKVKGIGNVKLLNFIMKYNKNINDMINHLEEILSPNDMLLFDDYLNEADYEIKRNNELGIKIISVFNENYPNKLIMIKDPVLYLYYKGDISLLNNTSVAIIGSRNVDESEKKLARDVAKYVSNEGITVVSGLALGTDVNAHLGSYKEKGKTIAILPSGLSKIVPKSNEKVANSIVDHCGLLVSEYSCDIEPSKYHFVKRDRIQAAMSDAVIVIKADKNSGTMNAVRIAQECNKYVAQYVMNNNDFIYNSFDKKIADLNEIIRVARDQKYIFEKEIVYEQESLF